MPSGFYCFNNTPVSFGSEIYLRCSDGDAETLFKISNGSAESLYQSESGFKLSDPSLTLNGVIFSEYAEGGTKKILRVVNGQIVKVNYKPQGMVDGIALVGEDKYIFRYRDFNGEQFVIKWSNTIQNWMDHPERSFVFVPSAIGDQLAYKVRSLGMGEDSPDRLYWWRDLNSSPLVLGDQAASTESQWKSFRNNVLLSGESLVFVGQTSQGDALGLMDSMGKDKILVQVGSSQVKELDYFSPSVNKKQMILFRGTDKAGFKTLFIWKDGELTHLLRQGDVVHTDKGIARVDYSNPNAIFMSAPFLSETHAYIQVALVDIDDPKTLMGVGLIEIALE